jgi:hypothetical protein
MVPDVPPQRRSKSLTAKVTEAEHAQLQELALASGQSVGEWARTVLLQQMNSSQEIVLAEILALRMLYLNTVQIVGLHGTITTEELRKLIERVDQEKHQRAQERLGRKERKREHQVGKG